MECNRRSLLKSVAVAGAAAAVSQVAEARARATAPPDALGLLYDTTKCIGCKTCVVACREANGTKPDTANAPGGLWDMPMDLNGDTKTIIKLYKSADGQQRSYFKAQCMQCVDPACTNACMLGALKKQEHGIVTYNQSLCIGCRYCQTACPFNVPKFEWSKAAAKIVKCELCRQRAVGAALTTANGFSRYPKGKGPACAEVCPRDAVIYGTRDELLHEARRRMKANPGRYVPTIYGEIEGGGTQVLYLSHVPFEDLGLPRLTDEPVPQVQQTVQHGIYQGFIAPVALYGVLGAVLYRNRRRAAVEKEGGEKGGLS
jgi:Fe-S-cluster-containing dehydrogenase component